KILGSNLIILNLDNFEGLEMIHSLYIINPAGICIYSEHFIESRIDEQLLTGFLTAIGSFSQEAIGGALQKINIRTGEQMVLFYHEESKLTIAAIAHENDYPSLLEHLLTKIIKEFYKTYKKYLKEQGLFEDTTKFSETCRKILSGRSANRGRKQIVLGLFLGLIVLIVLMALTGFMFGIIAQGFASSINDVTRFNNNLTNQLAIDNGWDPTDPFNPNKILAYLQAALIANAIFNIAEAMQYHFLNASIGAQLLLILSFVPSSLLGGYIAGSRNNGKWLGFLFFGCAFIIILIFIQLLLYYIIVYLPLILISSFVFGYYGGLLREMFKLYPLPPEKKLKEVKPERGILTKLEIIFAVFGSILFVAGLSGNPLILFGLILIVLAIIFEIKERRRS
ncbi:MAG: hypothetical protein ACFFCM_14445, partial [Promethearchaeota archaeon]